MRCDALTAERVMTGPRRASDNLAWRVGVLAVCALFALPAFACESSLPLKGAVPITTCDPHAAGCKPAAELVYEYTKSIPDDPRLFTIALHASPWRLYDAEMRIITIEELATTIRAKKGPDVEKVVLFGSWTDVAPARGGKSLARKLSDALGGFPVGGMDGFLWIAKDGSARTTHQAFTVKQSGIYRAMEGDEVMESLAVGWVAELEDRLVEKHDADNLMRAGAAWDIFHLCPEHALKTFETAAKLSNSIAAYNAALMRLERNADGDVKAATALLSQAAEAGDAKAQLRLRKLEGAEQ